MIERPARRRKKFSTYRQRSGFAKTDNATATDRPHTWVANHQDLCFPACQIRATGSPIRLFGGSKPSFAGSIPSFGPSKPSFGGNKRTRGGKSERNCQLFSIHLQRIRTLIVSIDLLCFCLSLSITKTARRRAPLTPPPPAASLLAYRIGRRAA